MNAHKEKDMQEKNFYKLLLVLPNIYDEYEKMIIVREPLQLSYCIIYDNGSLRVLSN